jgi:hypothetical protein
VLGVETTLAPESAQGAVLGTTAVVDASSLITDSDVGAPVFDDIAHEFLVQVYAALAPTPAVLDRVRWVVDREKPAHTTYQLCVIDARMRVGVQARLGIDAIVGGPPRPAPLDGTRELGVDTVLPDETARRRRVSLIGVDARVGSRSTLA